MFLTLVTLTLCRCLKQISILSRQTSTEEPLHPCPNNSNVIPSQWLSPVNIHGQRLRESVAALQYASGDITWRSARFALYCATQTNTHRFKGHEQDKESLHCSKQPLGLIKYVVWGEFNVKCGTALTAERCWCTQLVMILTLQVFIYISVVFWREWLRWYWSFIPHIGIRKLTAIYSRCVVL